jgi:hypothetical protein
LASFNAAYAIAISLCLHALEHPTHVNVFLQTTCSTMSRLHVICVAAILLAALLAPACAQTLSPTNQAALDRHNLYRARHGADPLVWDADLERYAVNYAALCTVSHDQSALRQLQQGENLGAGSGNTNETAVMLETVDDW